MAQPLVRGIDEEYAETYAFLCSFERFGILLGLENISSLLSLLDNPQRKFPSIHIAGSNGKGSTGAFLSSIFREAGLKTALYTSPHLNDFRERIRIDGVMVSKEAVVAATRKVRTVYDRERTTFFELTTAIAFDIISQAKPDMAVIEVGLGGRLDATNTIHPLATVITDISREHEDYLGTGIAAIAGEKAGIIKERVPVVSGATRAEAQEVILGRAEKAGSAVRLYGRDFRAVRRGAEQFSYRSETSQWEDIRISMKGPHQIRNAGLACAVAEVLVGQGAAISEQAIRRGLAHTRFPGRFELVHRNPDVIIDGAHSPESMRLLRSTLRQTYPGKRPFVLLAALGEKQHLEMVRILAPLAQAVVCVKAQGDRALDPEVLAEEVRSCGTRAKTAETIEQGFDQLFARASAQDVIVATGSLYMIGPVRKACGLADE
jgi:dihydrofolate synthase/folylpolyglutamate synthase